MFAILLTAIAIYLAFDYKRNQGRAPEKRVGLLAKFELPPYFYFNSLEEPKLSVLPLVLIGLVIGLLTGLMGISGVILLPVLVYLVGQRTVKAAGTCLLLVWTTK